MKSTTFLWLTDIDFLCAKAQTDPGRRRQRCCVLDAGIYADFRLHAPRNAISNDEVASSSKSQGSRFVGVGSVDISRPMEAMREIMLHQRSGDIQRLGTSPWPVSSAD